MASDPDSDGDVVTCLLEIAEEMFARGSPLAAAAYLERALAEPPPEAARGEVLTSLAFALGLVGPPTERNIDLLTEALRYTADPRRRAEIKLVLARALGTAGHLEEAMRAYDDATAEASEVDAELAFAMEVERIAAGIVVPGYGDDVPSPAAFAPTAAGRSQSRAGGRCWLRWPPWQSASSTSRQLRGRRLAQPRWEAER